MQDDEWVMADLDGFDALATVSALMLVVIIYFVMSASMSIGTWIGERLAELSIERHRDSWEAARLAILRADGVTASKLYASSTELVVDELAHAVLAQRRQGKELPHLLQDCADLFSARPV